jgi:hypothetical protein
VRIDIVVKFPAINDVHTKKIEKTIIGYQRKKIDGCRIARIIYKRMSMAA